jgi:hypothetical protein
VCTSSDDGWILNAFLIYFDRTTLLLSPMQWSFNIEMKFGKGKQINTTNFEIFLVLLVVVLVVFISKPAIRAGAIARPRECFINSTLFYEQKNYVCGRSFFLLPNLRYIRLNAWKNFCYLLQPGPVKNYFLKNSFKFFEFWRFLFLGGKKD